MPVSASRTTQHLLSLPAEVRRMIWTAVLANCIVVTDRYPFPLLTPIDHSWGWHAELGSRWYQDESLDALIALHFPRRVFKKSTGSASSAAPSASTSALHGTLSWLRTNRQIFREAQPIADRNLHLHFSSARVFLSALAGYTTPTLKMSAMRRMSLTLPITVVSDLRDGFAFSRNNPAGWWTPRELDRLIQSCQCHWCLGVEAPALPILDELQLHVYFTCQTGQGNDRPIIGRLPDGRPKKGMLHRPKNHPPLIWTDQGNAKDIEHLVGLMSDQMPLNLFAGKKKVKAVRLRFHVDSIQHNELNQCPHVRDKCWCLGRSIRKDSVPLAALTRELERLLCSEPRPDGLDSAGSK